MTDAASIFFVTYESLKSYLSRTLYPGQAHDAKTNSPLVHMASASVAEVAACLVRVPTEVVKSRQQTAAYGRTSSFAAFRQVVGGEGVAGLYRGFGGTILREIPFTCIQFPLYEFIKQSMAGPKKEPSWWQAAGAGSIAGSFAAAVTTPLDVIKTRIMLAKVCMVSHSVARRRPAGRYADPRYAPLHHPAGRRGRTLCRRRAPDAVDRPRRRRVPRHV